MSARIRFFAVFPYLPVPIVIAPYIEQFVGPGTFLVDVALAHGGRMWSITIDRFMLIAYIRSASATKGTYVGVGEQLVRVVPVRTRRLISA